MMFDDDLFQMVTGSRIGTPGQERRREEPEGELVPTTSFSPQATVGLELCRANKNFTSVC